jgi:hypothetical protein
LNGLQTDPSLDGVNYPGLPVACLLGIQLILKWSLGENEE